MKRLALTCGDPSGIGPEIAEKWIADHPDARGRVIPIGPAGWIDRLHIDGVPVGPETFEAAPGAPSEEGASVALAAMEEAARGCLEERYDAVVTGPISKEWLKRVGFPYPGQTEFFAARWGGRPTMGFIGEHLRLVLVTWHIPLSEVPQRVTEGDAFVLAVERAVFLAEAEGIGEPRIGICGLNPHAGESGMIGHEERDILEPLLKPLRKRWPGISPILAGDTVFLRALRGEFDVVVSLYHDQGLAAFKTVDFDWGVNVTLGLPRIRTSPDHGTAFDIAGKGRASARSLRAAIRLADRLAAASA